MNDSKLQALKPSSGWARPLKYKKKIYMLTGPRLWDIMGSMKEIIVRGKKVKVPFEDADYNLDGEENVTISNRFSGEKATVPGYAAAVYDVIMGAEQFQQWETHRKGLDWFAKYFPEQYMVLLD